MHAKDELLWGGDVPAIGLLELHKKQEVQYGATAVSALRGLTVARLRFYTGT